MLERDQLDAERRRKPAERAGERPEPAAAERLPEEAERHLEYWTSKLALFAHLHLDDAAS